MFTSRYEMAQAAEWRCVRLITPVPWLARNVTAFGPARGDAYYLARIRAGEPLPPVKLQNWGNIITIRDGNHRIWAAIDAGLAELGAEWRLKPGEADEWIAQRVLEGFRAAE
jgi:hypothetical protein